MNHDGPAQPIEALVIFSPAKIGLDTPRWFRAWNRWGAKRGYGHVTVAWFEAARASWVIVDGRYGRLDIKLMSDAYNPSDIMRPYQPTETLVAKVTPGLARGRPRGLLTCVSVAKAVLGLGGRSFTPWQLRQQLLSEGDR